MPLSNLFNIFYSSTRDQEILNLKEEIESLKIKVKNGKKQNYTLAKSMIKEESEFNEAYCELADQYKSMLKQNNHLKHINAYSMFLIENYVHLVLDMDKESFDLREALHIATTTPTTVSISTQTEEIVMETTSTQSEENVVNSTSTQTEEITVESTCTQTEENVVYSVSTQTEEITVESTTTQTEDIVNVVVADQQLDVCVEGKKDEQEDEVKVEQEENESAGEIGLGEINVQNIAQEVEVSKTTSMVEETTDVLDGGYSAEFCPVRESKCRIDNGDIHHLEKQENGKYFLVKKFQRSVDAISTNNKEDIRTPDILSSAMDYLVGLIRNNGIESTYSFIFDRSRAIRKDLAIHRCNGTIGIKVLEQCTRFHISSQFYLGSRGLDAALFDPVLNREQLSKCLVSLMDFYRVYQQTQNEVHPNEPEYRGYQLLLNLYNDDEVNTIIGSLHPSIIRHPSIKFALDVYLNIQSNNYCRLFKLERSGTFLQCCCLDENATALRNQAIETISKAYKSKGKNAKYNFKDLSSLLAMESSDMNDFISRHGGLKRVTYEGKSSTSDDIEIITTKTEMVFFKTSIFTGKAPLVLVDEINRV
ncbi:hypothetical protein DLAC_00401 [Tieghemostelium lacteum]|uniref:SAC3/GANP/THP3 conserved domain-containing protein n=1 Tax=Tieghemostelium lacteum TaxID=361077 RepID=A0A152A9W6_TIELA|nr:hypothetical protein DLAC_00401 [Tieghemostelium lacteum]|eukprot:KYR02921.1 hypothetical protein DLAC_00401 [Tieghemostelium lacteum]